MDDKEKFITVSHNENDTNDTQAAPEAAVGITDSADMRENTAYEPAEGTEAADAAEGGEAPEANVSDNSENTAQPAKYDSFMYEPIGFEELERQQQAAEKEAAEKKEKRRRTRSERIMILLLSLICTITAALAIYAVIRDLARSDEALAPQISSPEGNVVLYRESKPEGANDAEKYKDENGRYTTEGVAAAVRPSIVEIYTYSDSRHTTLLGTGSGIVISDDGYIVTNTHVLDSNGYHVVMTSDDESYDAKIIGRDAKTDIAILKVNGADLEPAVLGNSDEVVVGEQVMAIGNPAGLSGSVTDGIVSAVNRKIKGDTTGFEMNCIQTNADISPGNSGGALVNMYGQVIGITSSKYVSSSYEGLGFAITINDALPIIEELINNGFISGRFKIGIQLIDMSDEYNIMGIEEELGYELPDDFAGIYIAEIADDCDIANTDLEAGDFITAINGKSVSTYDELYDALSSQYSAGDYVPATCAHVTEDGKVEYYEIEFMLMEDTSGDY